MPARRRQPVAVLVMTALGVVMVIASAAAQARLVWNFTPSIPVGLYSIEERAWKVEDLVALKPSGRLLQILQTAGVLKDGRLLMKRVAATGGDEVCRSGQELSINGLPRAVARQVVALAPWSGCHRLEEGEVFLLGETDNSFDGRYFGVTSASDIVGPLRPLLVF